MTAGRFSTRNQIALIVKQCLEEGKAVEIDGLGTFRPNTRRGFRFWPARLPKVFLAYVAEDGPIVDRLYTAFEESGFAPWMDRRKLMPGQNWPRAIEEAIETSEFFVPCFSQNSVSKKGGFQAEIRYALDCARRVPLDDVYIVPVRLDACCVPARIQRELQYIDLFPHWGAGLRRLFTVMGQAVRRRESPRVSGPPPRRDLRRA
jgi:TIR domain